MAAAHGGEAVLEAVRQRGDRVEPRVPDDLVAVERDERHRAVPLLAFEPLVVRWHLRVLGQRHLRNALGRDRVRAAQGARRATRRFRAPPRRPPARPRAARRRRGSLPRSHGELRSAIDASSPSRTRPHIDVQPSSSRASRRPRRAATPPTPRLRDSGRTRTMANALPGMLDSVDVRVAVVVNEDRRPAPWRAGRRSPDWSGLTALLISAQ